MDNPETVKNPFESILLQLLGIQNQDIIPVSGQLRVQLGEINENKKPYLLEPTKFELQSTELTLLFNENFAGGFEIYLFNKNGYVRIIFYKGINHSGWLIENINIVVFDGSNFHKPGHKVWGDVKFRDGCELTINRQCIVLNNPSRGNTRKSDYVMYSQSMPINNSYRKSLGDIFKGENAGFDFISVIKTDPTSLQTLITLILRSSFNTKVLVVPN